MECNGGGCELARRGKKIFTEHCESSIYFSDYFLHLLQDGNSALMKAAAVGLHKNVEALLAHWRIEINLQDKVEIIRAPIVIFL